MPPLEPKRILVINVTRIGDTLLTTPVLRALAKAWPGAEITFAGHSKRIEILRHLPFVHTIKAIGRQGAVWRGHIRKRQYDLALVYGSDASLHEYALRVASNVIAFRPPIDRINQRLFAIGGEDSYLPEHAVTWLLQLIRPLKIPHAGFHLSYNVTPEENTWARNFLLNLDVNGSPLVGLQIASFPTKAFRDWPATHFEALCHKILALRPRARFVLFGGGDDSNRTKQLSLKLEGAALSVAGSINLRQTAALMNLLDLYIGVDTGPTHMMGALHRPMIAMYHPTSPRRALAPLEHPCCHAIDHPSADKPEATIDIPMAEISVETVWEHVQAVLSGAPFPAPIHTRWQ